MNAFALLICALWILLFRRSFDVIHMHSISTAAAAARGSSWVHMELTTEVMLIVRRREHWNRLMRCAETMICRCTGHLIVRRVILRYTRTHVCTHAHAHTTILWLYEFCLGQPGWAGTRRNIHPLTPIVVINRPLSDSSIYYDPWHASCSVHLPDSHFHNLSPSFLWSTSWPCTLHFMLHTFLHPIIVFFSQHKPIPSQPVSL